MANKSDEILSVAERLAILETEVESIKKHKYVLDGEVDLNVFAAKDAKHGDLKKLVNFACGNAMTAKMERGDGGPSGGLTITMADLNSAWNMVAHLSRSDLKTKKWFESNSSSKKPPARGT